MPKLVRPRTVRVPIEMTPEQHASIKIHASLSNQTFKSYVLCAVAEKQQREQLLVKYIDRPIDEA